MNNLPLEGIVVVDLTNVLSGPYASMILADLGAKIIKVEKPGGDDSRQYGPFINKKSCYFISLNRGKKSIMLDLKKIKHKKIFEKILSKSDILVDNFKPGTLEKLGYDWNYLSQNFPKLIHGKISGFGETGILKDQPAYDIVVQAMGGLMSITGHDKKSVARVGTSIGDIASSLFCVIGILSQLLRRNKTNLGSKLDLSMLDCQVAILENAISRFSVNKINPIPLGTDHPSISPFGAFNTKDNKIVIAIGNEDLFKRFCLLIKDEKMLKDDKFSTNMSRNLNLKDLKKRIELKLSKKTSEYWIKIFSKSKIPCSKINEISDVINNKQIIDRNMIYDYPVNSTESIKVSSSPFNFSFCKKNKQIKLAPELNQDEKEILKYFDID